MHGKWSQSSNFWDFVSSSSVFNIESMTVSDAIFLGIEAHFKISFKSSYQKHALKTSTNQKSEWKPTWIFLIFLNDTVIIHPPSNIRFQFSADRFVANQRPGIYLKTCLRLRVTIWSNVPIQVILKMKDWRPNVLMTCTRCWCQCCNEIAMLVPDLQQLAKFFTNIRILSPIPQQCHQLYVTNMS